MFPFWRTTPPEPTPLEDDEAQFRELQMRDVRCHMIRGDEYWYTRSGSPAELAQRPFVEEDCVRGQRWRPHLGKRRVNLFQLPAAQPFTAQAVAPTVPDHIAVVDTLAPQQPGGVQARQKRPRHFTRKPGDIDNDPSQYALPSALADYDMDLTQDVLYQYARGWVDGTPAGRYDRRMDWTALTEPNDESGAPIMPPGTCGSDSMHIKPHQMTVWTVLRAWAARQGSRMLQSLTAPQRIMIDDGEPLTPADGARAHTAPSFDAHRTPKGFLVFHSLGSGKTNVTVCGMQAFWNQRLEDGSPRPIIVITSKENKGQMAKRGDGSSRYYSVAKGMFPSSLGALSSDAFHAGYELLSFNQAGLRLGYPMADLAEGVQPRRDASKAKPDFVAKMRHAVILIDEPQGMFAPLPAFRNTNGGLREWLSSREADGATIVLLTATPGKSVSELFTLLNVLKRAEEQLAPADYVHATDAGTLAVDDAAFRKAVAGQVSFVDLSNNTHDFPAVTVEVVRAPMSEAHFQAWRDKALEDAHEEAADGPRAWAHLFNKAEYAKTSRAWSNMVYPGSKVAGAFARDVYKRGQLDDVAAYSSKLSKLVTNIAAHEGGGKQYVYSAFGEQGIHQVSDVLQAQGWTNVSGQVKSLYEAVAALRRAERSDDAAAARKASDRVAAAVGALPGKPFRRFITTREWRDDAPVGGAGKHHDDDEDDADTRRGARTTEQLMELDVFNAVRNIGGEAVALLLASKKFNEGLDLKGIRFMHIFEPLVSVPEEQQTGGRGARYCSHAALDPADRNMVIYHYFSVEPTGQAELADSVAGLEAAAETADSDAAAAAATIASLQQRVQQLAARAGVLKFATRLDMPDMPDMPDMLADVDSFAPDTEPARAAEKPVKAKSVKTRKTRAPRKAKPSLDDAMSSLSLEGGDQYDPLADMDDMEEHDMEGGASLLREVAIDLPAAAIKGAVAGLRQGYADWWNRADVAAAQEATAREADAGIAEVRQALLQQERVMEATQRRLADAAAAGQKPDWTSLVQADLAKDRVRLLKEQAATLQAAKKQVAKEVRTIEQASVTGAARAQLVAVQGELRGALERMDVAATQLSAARAAAAAARKEAAVRRARVLPEWRHLIDDDSGGTRPVQVMGSGVGGRVLKRDQIAAAKAAQPVILTDVLIHGISRREYEPMKLLLQAMRDAAIDCQVLHGLHARMGVATNCRV